jgi:hypothetical protein
VDFQDLVLLAQRYGATLPVPAASAILAGAVDAEIKSIQSPFGVAAFNTTAPIRKQPVPAKPKKAAAARRF